MDLTAAPYGGARYSVETRMDGRIVARFDLDAGMGDVVKQPLETAECHDWLGFAGIGKPCVRMISREQQFAEKIHPYTLPRSSPNSRVKDLVDLALLVADNQLDRRKVINPLHLTFDRRGTRALPARLSVPPPEWQTPFRARAEECGLRQRARVSRKRSGGQHGAVTWRWPAEVQNRFHSCSVTRRTSGCETVSSS